MRSHLNKAVLLVGHGSFVRGFARAMRKVARALEERRSFGRVRCAYLKGAPPTVERALETLVCRGAREIRVLPYFLLLGRHIQRDLPRLVRAARKKYKGRAVIRLCPYLGFDARLVEVAAKRLGGKKRALR